MQTKPQHVTLDDLLRHKERSVRRLADELWREYESVETVPSVSLTHYRFIPKNILHFKPALR